MNKPGLTFNANFKMEVFESNALASVSAKIEGPYVKELTGEKEIELVNMSDIEIPLEVLDMIADSTRNMMEAYNPAMVKYLEQF